MMKMTKIDIIVGIDNGVTGSIGVFYLDGHSDFIITPTRKELSYTKEKQYIHRIDWDKLLSIIPPLSYILIERPMVNPRAFTATTSALRALESTLMVIEMLACEYEYIDSKEWQREFIASSIIGHDALKDASKKIGIELHPEHEIKINKHGDADGLLIAEYGVRKYNR